MELWNLIHHFCPTRIWREKEARFNIKILAFSVKHGKDGGTWFEVVYLTAKVSGSLVRIEGQMNHRDYIINILGNQLLQENFLGKKKL